MASFVMQYGYAAVFLLVGLESLGVPLPGETALISAGIFAGSTHSLNLASLIAVAALGAIIGDNFGYLIGHWGGYRVLVRYGHYVRLDQRKVKVARYIFLRHGAKVVFFGRFVSILRTYAAFLAGTTRMPYRRFLFFNAAGGIVWSTLWATLAYFLGTQVNRFSGPIAIVFGIAGAAVLIVGLVVLRRQEARLEEVAEQALPGPLEGYADQPAQ